MLHSKKLRYIDEIARTGSIRKAAARLHVASSAINRQLLALEEEFGVPLFERLPRGLRLTAAGEMCVEHIREVLKAYEKTESRIRGLRMPQTGNVSLVTTGGLSAGMMPGILAEFASANPRVRVRLLSDVGSATINTVVSGEADLGLGFNIPALPTLRVVAGFDVPVGVVLPPGHRLAAQESIDPAEVLREKLIACAPGNSLRDAINLIFAPLAQPIEPVLETNSVELMKQLVLTGAGITLLNPLDVQGECRKGTLLFRPFAPSYVRHQPLKIFVRARSTLDASASLFVDFLIARVAARVRQLQETGSIPCRPERDAE